MPEKITTMAQLMSAIADKGKEIGASEGTIKMIQECAEDLIEEGRQTIESFAARIPHEFDGLVKAARKGATESIFATIFS